MSKKSWLIPVLGLSAMATAVQAQLPEPVPYPEPQTLDQRGDIHFILREDLQAFKALDSYSEPEFMTALVKEGKLPPVAERLPEKPLVFKASGMSDGIGEYGGIMRIVTHPPQNWNWAAGGAQGYGGANYTVQECLTRTGPLFQVKAEDIEPLPNLAKSWEWSDDGHQLTMNLIRGAKWSDGHPFTTDDVMFLWEDNILDPNVPSIGSRNIFGPGAELESLDDYTIRWTFDAPFPGQALFSMSDFNFCPGPAHLLRDEHPRYNADKTYNDYFRAFGPERLPWVTMGAWAAVEYRPDQVLVLRRNPYYWKVDEKGQQLPYTNEKHFLPIGIQNRTAQTMAGNADLSNMENPPVYLETLRLAGDENSSVRLAFGPRTLGWQLHMNLAETLGAHTERERLIRQLNRDYRFRRAVTHAIDRQALGQSLTRGPFTHVYAGGLFPETGYFDKDSVAYFDYQPEISVQLLSELGLRDINGDGYMQWADGPLKGDDLEITLLYHGGDTTEEPLVDNLVSMLGEVGLKIITRPMPPASRDASRDASEFDFMIRRGEQPYITPDQQYYGLAAVSPTAPLWHRGNEEHPQNLLPFEEELKDLILTFQKTSDPDEKVELMKQYNEIFTNNVYHVGLTVAPGALIINQRLRNVPEGAPILAYQWAEDAIVRERMWVPGELQMNEIFEGTLPGIN